MNIAGAVIDTEKANYKVSQNCHLLRVPGNVGRAVHGEFVLGRR